MSCLTQEQVEKRLKDICIVYFHQVFGFQHLACLSDQVIQQIQHIAGKDNVTPDAFYRPH